MNIYKGLMSSAVLLILVFSLTACSSSEEAASTSTSDETTTTTTDSSSGSSATSAPSTSTTATATSAPTASPTPTATPSYSVYSGKYNICLYSGTGSAYCEGEDNQGSMGNGATTGSVTTPTAVLSGPITSIEYGGTNSGGNVHVCAIVSGALYCWGDNSLGQQGTGSTGGTVTTPASLYASGVTGLTVSMKGVYAIRTGGALYAWGYNANGQVGNGTTTTPVNTPYLAIASGVTKVVASYDGTTVCAIVSAALYCWGNNATSQIGDGTVTSPATSPTQAIASGVTDVATNQGTTCAVVSGAVKCWGKNTEGQVGSVASAYETSMTTVIASGASSIYLTEKGSTACALKSDGSVYCWGLNSAGQVGNGSTSASVVVPYNTIASGATSMDFGYSYFCAVVSAAVKCWGAQAPNGTLTSPTSVSGATAGATQISIGGDNNDGVSFLCASVSGRIKCLGSDWTGNVNSSTWVELSGHP